jgi:hypothetical protein
LSLLSGKIPHPSTYCRTGYAGTRFDKLR